jgi:hypothetical protein
MSWLISKALMNSLSLPEPVEEYLGESCSDGEPSVQLNGNPIQLAYLSQDKMTDFSRLSRFGMMFKPLTVNRGEELLTLYLAVFHAKTSVQPEKAQELMESDPGCGEKWRGSFTKYDQDSRSWKTHQCSLLGDLEPFLETWPRWGLMRDGECWEQPTLEQTIRETGSGLSPNGVDTFHTPNTTGLDGGSNGRKALKKKLEIGTPTASMSVRSEKFAKGRIPSPSEFVEKYPTPTCHNSKEGAFPSEYNRNTPSLAIYAGGKLNPTWVEWLMGWPLEWTDLKPLETDKFHYVQQKHGES